MTGDTSRCSWREDELIDKMKLDSDHDKQVQLSHFLSLFAYSCVCACDVLASQVDAALSRAEAVRACTEIGKMLCVAAAAATAAAAMFLTLCAVTRRSSARFVACGLRFDVSLI